jgi:hypothetical protein
MVNRETVGLEKRKLREFADVCSSHAETITRAEGSQTTLLLDVIDALEELAADTTDLVLLI